MTTQDAPILIVEANSFFQNMLNSIFRKLGLRSEIVSNLESAADLMSRTPFSFVMLDATLPGVNSGQTVPYLQRLTQKPTAVILMVPEEDPNPQGTLAAAQGNGYLIKPFTEGEITTWLGQNAQALLGHAWSPGTVSFNDAPGDLEMGADPVQIETWLENIRSSDPLMAIDAIENLVRNQVSQAIQPLVDFSYEAEGDTKIAVLHALGKLGDNSATEALVANLNHSDPRLKETAIEALGELQDPRALRPLSRILRVNDKKMILLAIKALGMLRVQEAKDILSPLLQSKDPQIKANVQWAIRVIDGMDV